MSTWDEPEPGEELAGLEVACWFRPADAQAAVGLSSRTLLRYTKQGLPSSGSGPSKRYALPHTVLWIRALTLRRDRGETVTHVPFDLALAEHLELRAYWLREGLGRSAG